VLSLKPPMLLSEPSVADALLDLAVCRGTLPADAAPAPAAPAAATTATGSSGGGGGSGGGETWLLADTAAFHHLLMNQQVWGPRDMAVPKRVVWYLHRLVKDTR